MVSSGLGKSDMPTGSRCTGATAVGVVSASPAPPSSGGSVFVVGEIPRVAADSVSRGVGPPSVSKSKEVQKARVGVLLPKTRPYRVRYKYYLASPALILRTCEALTVYELNDLKVHSMSSAVSKH